MPWQRPDGRQHNQLRPHHFQRDFTSLPLSSVLTVSGNTQVLCTISIELGVPKFLVGTGTGWLTAEYRMLPNSTFPRQPRELMKLSGRTQEIQRLIGRSLRAAIDLTAIGERTISVDTDVLQADAGTRTAAITGSYVALASAIEKLIARGELERSPLITAIAAVSVGLIEGDAFLDLDYAEDVKADVDLNVIMNSNLELIEIQGTAESRSFNRSQLNQMLDLAEQGIKELLSAQNQVLITF
ncbi:MAG: ribonuclease PH [Xenococcaceae cyanobacterium MO_188.B32]|nr:ribonuclease PH [Xenococcaceae cyanobacterium MO_188.B32]